MKKREFLNKLRKRLDILEDREIDDIISEYEGYIEEKVKAGKTEEEAVKELGDIEEIAKEMLFAYKVKDKKENDGFLNNIASKISDFIDSLDNKSSKDIIKIIIEIILIMLVIGIIRLPFSLIKDLGETLFLDLDSPTRFIFKDIWEFIIDLSYVVISIIFFVKMLDKRVFKKFTDNLVELDNNKSKDYDKEIEKEKRQEQDIDKLDDVFSIIIKVFLGMFSLIAAIFLLAITIILGIMIYLVIKGVKYYGILLFVISLFLGGVFFLETIVKYIFKKQMQAWNILGKVFIVIILMGAGLVLGAIEIANTEIVKDANTITRSVTREIVMRDNLKIRGYNEIKLDNTLGDVVKIEYKYPDYSNRLRVEIELDNCYNGSICLDEDIENFTWNVDMLKAFISGLRNKKIYINDFKIYKTIYVNQDNYNILTKNVNNSNNTNNVDINNNTSNQDNNVSFIRTYNVLNLIESNDNKYVYLTLRRFQDDDVETVRVSRELALNVEANKNYEFTFNINLNEISRDFEQDDIEDIFKEAKLIKINYTDKVGLEQIQESIYK